MIDLPGFEMYILDREHRPVRTRSLTMWGRFMQSTEKRRVGYTSGKGVEISTVFLGLDHRWSGKGPPLLFETAVFREDGVEIIARYSSWDDAEAGHRATVRRLISHRVADQPS